MVVARAYSTRAVRDAGCEQRRWKPRRALFGWKALIFYFIEIATHVAAAVRGPMHAVINPVLKLIHRAGKHNICVLAAEFPLCYANIWRMFGVRRV